MLRIRKVHSKNRNWTRQSSRTKNGAHNAPRSPVEPTTLLCFFFLQLRDYCEIFQRGCITFDVPTGREFT